MKISSDVTLGRLAEEYDGWQKLILLIDDFPGRVHEMRELHMLIRWKSLRNEKGDFFGRVSFVMTKDFRKM